MTSTRSALINQALMQIPRRADSVDRATLVRTFVAVGPMFAMLGSVDHQILFGRRGTGKTHALLCLAELVGQGGDVPVYIDLRTIGSAGGLYSDPHVELAYRGTQLLIDTVEAIHEALAEYALAGEGVHSTGLLSGLDALAEAATSVEVVGDVERETVQGDSRQSGRNTSLGITLAGGGAGLSLGASAAHQATRSWQERTRRSGQERHHVLFGPLGRALRGVVGALGGARLWILLDEWSSVPAELQPFLADLLRRSLFPVPGMTVKIAAIQRRTRFCQVGENGDYIGIEVGADAAAGLDLDDFLIVGREEERAQSFLRTLLFNHAIAHTAQPGRLGRAAASPSDFVQAAFKKGAFPEFVRAAEGIPRDAINLAALAAQYADHSSIGIQDVRRAAGDWYLRDKHAAITASTAAQQVLQALVNEVVGRRKARTFLLDQAALREHPAIQDLYDARLLHVLRHGITMPEHPGARYDGFAIDYGCYVALLFTDKDFELSSNWYDTWLRARPDVAPDNFHDIERSLIDLTGLDRTTPPRTRATARRPGKH